MTKDNEIIASGPARSAAIEEVAATPENQPDYVNELIMNPAPMERVAARPDDELFTSAMEAVYVAEAAKRKDWGIVRVEGGKYRIDHRPKIVKPVAPVETASKAKLVKEPKATRAKTDASATPTAPRAFVAIEGNPFKGKKGLLYDMLVAGMTLDEGKAATGWASVKWDVQEIAKKVGKTLTVTDDGKYTLS